MNMYINMCRKLLEELSQIKDGVLACENMVADIVEKEKSMIKGAENIIVCGLSPVGRRCLSWLKKNADANVYYYDEREDSIHDIGRADNLEMDALYIICSRESALEYLKMISGLKNNVLSYNELFLLDSDFELKNSMFHNKKYVLDRMQDAVNHAKDYLQLLGDLQDIDSQEVLSRLILYRITLDIRLFYDVKTKGVPYFSEPFLEFGADDVIVDAGGYNGDSLRDFIQVSNNRYGRYYFFEPDCNLIQEAKSSVNEDKRIAWCGKALYSHGGILSFCSAQSGQGKVSENGDSNVETIALDDMEICPSFVKMDVEGSEMEALAGMKETLCTSHPTLAICIYHKAGDVWDIYHWLKMFGGYNRFWMRCNMDSLDYDVILYAKKTDYIYLKGLNSCNQRKQNLQKYSNWIGRNGQLCENIEDADTICIWTCGFREDVRNNTLSYIKETAQAYSDKMFLVCGCLPDIMGTDLAEWCNQNITHYKIIPWKKENEYFKRIEECEKILCEKALCRDVEVFKETNPDKSITFHDKFIKLVISEGCSCECVYCSEKKMLPEYRSYPLNQLVDTCRETILKNKMYDVMLIADSLGEYGSDICGDVTLITLIESLVKIDKRVTVSLNNLNPQFLLLYLEDIMHYVQLNKIKHINLPIQSASTSVLKRMNRKYTKKELEIIMEAFEKSGFKEWDTHVLIGFDGETEEEFLETVEFIVQWHVRYVLASRYMSIGQGKYTPVGEEEKRRREAALLNICRENNTIINCDGSELKEDRMRRIKKGD